MLVLTRRDRPVRAEADALAADLANRGVEVSEVQLGPLADGELAAVVCSVAPLTDDDLRRAVAAAEGNPLLAVESARALAAPPRRRTCERWCAPRSACSPRAVASSPRRSPRPDGD
jgi:hypothetical protein